MYIDEWAAAINTLDIIGVDVEDLLLLIDWTSRNDVHIDGSHAERKRHKTGVYYVHHMHQLTGT